MSSFSLIYIFVTIIQFSTYFALSSHLQFAEDVWEETHGKIVFSSLLFRHGDRAVSQQYETDPNPKSVWKEGFGQLTKRGKQRAFQLGQWIRERYRNTLLKEGYRADLISANSSSIDRTIQSGLLVLAGALPPSNNFENWTSDPSLRWQPIPLFSISKKIDNMISCCSPCDRYTYERQQLNSNTEAIAFHEKYRDLIEKVFEYADRKKPSNNIIENVEILWDIYDCLSIEESYNLTLPLWAQEFYPEPLRTVATKRFEISVLTPEMKRLTSGVLLNKIVKAMLKKRNDSLYQQTVHFYSGHDTTIAPFLQIIGVYNHLVPPFSSLVIVELRRKNDEYIVTLMYRNSTEAPPDMLKIPGCGDVCTLDKFVSITKSLIVEDWDAACQVDVIVKLQQFSMIDIIIVLLAACVLILVGLIVIRIFIVNRKSQYMPF